MSELVVSWERAFQVWQYSVSHSQVILRSVDPRRYTTRIDLTFVGIRAMHVRDSYESLTVTREEPDGRAIMDPSWLSEPLQCFVVNGGPDYLLATNFGWHEDHGDHHTPSKFGPLPGTE